MKMKKLVAVLLACVMLCALAVPALGESGYEFLKGFLSDPNKNSLSFGTPIIESREKSSNIILYYMGDGILCLSGVNSKGQGEVCFWFGVSETDTLITCYNMCTLWNALTDVCDYGYHLAIAFKFDADSDPILVTDATTAAAFAGAVDSIVH